MADLFAFPDVLGIVGPVAAAAVIIFLLHRRRGRKSRQEQRIGRDRFEGIENGLMDAGVGQRFGRGGVSVPEPTGFVAPVQAVRPAVRYVPREVYQEFRRQQPDYVEKTYYKQGYQPQAKVLRYADEPRPGQGGYVPQKEDDPIEAVYQGMMRMYKNMAGMYSKLKSYGQGRDYAGK